MSGRLPFDPSRIEVPPEERAAAAEQPLTPSEVNERVRGCLRRGLPASLTVVGEIGNLSTPRSGHVYFTLKDDESELRAVMWRSAASRLKFTPESGLEVVARGPVEVYLPRGTYSLQIRSLEPRGVGALELAFRQRCAKLQAEGLFDPTRKRPLPRIPARIGLITSPRGAAIRDILQTLTRRFPALEIVVAPVAVQGASASAEIAAAIRQCNLQTQRLGPLDVLIVGRGGGSLEDLWAFNEEHVARAIAASRIPIISAVGHEVDVTISDLVADVRAATPTAAAELVAPHQNDLRTALTHHHDRLAQQLRDRLRNARHTVDALAARESLARPIARLDLLRRDTRDALHAAEASLRTTLHCVRARAQSATLAIARFGAGSTFARLTARLDRIGFRVSRAVTRQLLHRERRLHRALRHAADVSPTRRLQRYRDRIRTLHWWLERLTRSTLADRNRLLAARRRALDGYNPVGVLRRGYSITRDAKTGAILRTTAAIRDGQRIDTQLADGTFRSTADDPRQGNLFDE